MPFAFVSRQSTNEIFDVVHVMAAWWATPTSALQEGLQQLGKLRDLPITNSPIIVHCVLRLDNTRELPAPTIQQILAIDSFADPV